MSVSVTLVDDRPWYCEACGRKSIDPGASWWELRGGDRVLEVCSDCLEAGPATVAEWVRRGCTERLAEADRFRREVEQLLAAADMLATAEADSWDAAVRSANEMSEAFYDELETHRQMEE